MEARIGVHIMSNIDRYQVYSGYKRSILQEKLFYNTLWVEEISHEMLKLYMKPNINHYKPTPIITNDIAIMVLIMEEYEDMDIVVKLNEIWMYLRIVYLSEVHGKYIIIGLNFL